jgi:hypothetical protein
MVLSLLLFINLSLDFPAAARLTNACQPCFFRHGTLLEKRRKDTIFFDFSKFF